MRKIQQNTIHSQKFVEAQKRHTIEDKQRKEWEALKENLAKLAEKETMKEQLDREYCNLTKDSSQENIRICGGEKMNKRPFALCAPNTGWKINPFETNWDTHQRLCKEEIKAKKQAGIRWRKGNFECTTSACELKKAGILEDTAAYLWIITNAPRNPFARSLMKYYKRHNQLTKKQLAAVEKNLQRPHPR